MKIKPVLKEIQAISFDLDDTLWHTAPVIKKAQTKIKQHILEEFQQFNPETLDEEFMESLVLVREEHPQSHHTLTEMRRLSFVKMLDKYGYDTNLSHALIEKFLHFRHEVTLYPDVEECLHFLQGKYKVASLTNGNANVMRLEIGKYFDVHLSSEEVGVKKPDRMMFHQVSRSLEIPHQRILHVGDNPVDDVQGAVDAGLQAIWINRSQNPWPLDSADPHEIRDLSELIELLS